MNGWLDEWKYVKNDGWVDDWIVGWLNRLIIG
jgi:hypothetical protein